MEVEVIYESIKVRVSHRTQQYVSQGGVGPLGEKKGADVELWAESVDKDVVKDRKVIIQRRPSG